MVSCIASVVNKCGQSAALLATNSAHTACMMLMLPKDHKLTFELHKQVKALQKIKPVKHVCRLVVTKVKTQTLWYH